MFGDNPKRSAVNSDGSILSVKNIFKTLQAEGPNAGVPSVFIRLGGCNLSCSFCDTEFEDYKDQNLDEILDEIGNQALNNNGQSVIKLVVITGGEPFRQPIGLLCKRLIDEGFAVQIETNGTLYRDLPQEVEIICSPKISNGKYLPIRNDLLERISAFKFLISENIPGYSSVPQLGQKEYNIPVFVQAMDEYNSEKNTRNQKLTVQFALNNNYRLSYQMHKNLGIE